MPENTGQPDPWLNLSWNDLGAWAGPKTLARGRKYQHEHRVEDIARASGDELVAWVEGSERYATTITTGDGNLRSWCTCPVGTSCKHAVAVVLEYLESLKNNVPVRPLADNDPRLLIFARFMPGNETDLPFAKDTQHKTIREISGNRESRCDLSTEEKLHVYFNGLTKADLVEVLDKICKEAPEIGQDILARNVLVSAAPEALLESLVTDIAMLAREPGMEVYGKWRSAATDYSSMNDRMEVLLTSGFADAVLGCGRDLFQFANAEIEEMDENGGDYEYGEYGEDGEESEEIVEEVSECIKTVFLALERSTLPVHERMMYVADLEFNDEYGLCPQDHSFWMGPFTEDDWSRFADLLITRLEADEDEVEYEENFPFYSSEDFNKKLLFAFDAANRSDDAERFCIGAAVNSGYSPSLVRYLIRMKRWEEARQWIGREIRQEHGHSGKEEELRTLLCELWEQEDDWLHIAGMRAEVFLSSPSIYGYPKLKLASERAGVWWEVSEEILDFLAQDKTPVSCVSQSGEGEMILGILPRSGIISLKPERRIPVPAFELLIAIAIEENDPCEVLVWYDLYMTEKPACPLPPVLVEEIAVTIAEKFPGRAVALQKQIAEVYLKEARPKSYESAIRQIRMIRDTLKRQDLLPEWELYIGELKKNHKRKKLFIDMLAILDERPIVQR
ncbi:MAG: SWIM zinc finger family protein [Methanomicrobiales archaeon]